MEAMLMSTRSKVHGPLLLALLMAAAEAHAFDALGTVIGVTPITETVNSPTQSCWTESVQPSPPGPQQHDYLGAILGGVAGGLLGSRFGEGNGRVAGAAVVGIVGLAGIVAHSA
jgi:uncharacterized protein YcfJ